MSDPNVVDAEIVEESPSSIVKADAPAEISTANLWGTDDPAEIVKKATNLAKAIIEPIRSQDLISNIGGREHPKIEAWTFVGSMVGVYAVDEWTQQVPDANGQWAEPRHGNDAAPGKGGWKARVVAKRADGAVVGAAEAECRWSEKNWSMRDSYALLSMAQTRAASKALRMPLDFILKLAGFATTPAEEVTGRTAESVELEAAAAEGMPACPSCGSGVYDNRETATGKQPRWRCKSKSCKGGSQDRPWASWDPAEFNPKLPAELPVNIDEIEAKLLEALGAEDANPENLAKQYAEMIAGGDLRNAAHLYKAALDSVTEELEDGEELAWSAETAAFVTDRMREVVQAEEQRRHEDDALAREAAGVPSGY